LIEESHQGRDVFLVQAGLLKGVKTDDLAREVVIQLAEPGDLIGTDVLANQPSSATWQAVVPSQVAAFDVVDVRAALRREPDLAFEFFTLLARRLARMETRVRDFAHKSARKRASEVLLRRARSPGAGHGTPVVRNLTRQDLAAMAGMTPETFIRILSSLREKGIVETRGRLISILDGSRLAHIAGTTAPIVNGTR
jgi:CRP-like cAMP-binding protein